MENQTVSHNTFVIERNYPATPEQVFAALADPDKRRFWFVEGYNKEADAFEMDFRVGGTELFRYHYREGAPFSGIEFVNWGSYQDIVPNRRVVGSSTMTIGGRCISASLLTYELFPAEEGTKLVFTFQGAFFERSDGPQIRELGWNKLLDRLGEGLALQLVEHPSLAVA
jgi:uncharacterized protein YndB with AHSA1/START domain